MAAFLRDIVDLAKPGSNPIVLFGRTGAVQDAWLWLDDAGIDAPVLEIGYYDENEASKFARLQAQHIRRESHQREPDARAIELILDGLRKQTLRDGGVFAGYSPVLIAVAKRVADRSEQGTANTQELISRLESGEEKFTLDSIVRQILDREQKKLERLKLQDESLRSKLYSPGEQIARLVSRLYGGALEVRLPEMSATDQETYRNALETWVQEHPFLDGEGKAAASAVFAGRITAEALNTTNVGSRALALELARGTTANPFLAEFYMSRLDLPRAERYIPSEHIGIIYASIRARLSITETASLRIEAERCDDELSGVVENFVLTAETSWGSIKTQSITVGAHKESACMSAINLSKRRF